MRKRRVDHPSQYHIQRKRTRAILRAKRKAATLYGYAKRMTLAPTPAEAAMKTLLKQHRIPCKTQQIFGSYIVDFFIPKERLIIEVDGLIHQDFRQSTYDRIRSIKLRDWHCHIIRFTNAAVLNHPGLVAQKIQAKLNQIHII